VPAAYTDTRIREITEAGYRVFARRGFAEATMQEIATEAGLSVGALYQYFKGKDEIVVAAGQFVRERHLGMIDRAFADAGSAEEAIDSVTRHALGALGDPDNLYRFRNLVSLWAEAPRNDRIASALRETAEAAAERLSVPWRDIQSHSGLPEGVEAGDIAHVMMAMREGLAVMLLAGVPVDIEACIHIAMLMTRALLLPAKENS
jgi:AcrR family transcriptional regulator